MVGAWGGGVDNSTLEHTLSLEWFSQVHSSMSLRRISVSSAFQRVILKMKRESNYKHSGSKFLQQFRCSHCYY